MNILIKQLIIVLCICSTNVVYAQHNTDSSTHQPYKFGDFGGIVYLDSMTVTATRLGFDIEDFIRMVQTDESFYTSFTNLHRINYISDHRVELFNKKGKLMASYASTAKHQSDGDCRSMEILEESTSGNYYKSKNELRYYTAQLHDYVFYTVGRKCLSEENETQSPKDKDKHVAELKKLIFQPGTEADVPLIGNRTAVFNDKMSQYYDFTIQSKQYKDSIECYVFTAKVKEEFQDRKENKTIIKFMETYFEKDKLAVVGRSYHLEYLGPIFSFDVNMKIELGEYRSTFLPVNISYDGWWDVPFKKRETAKFTIRFHDFYSNGVDQLSIGK